MIADEKTREAAVVDPGFNSDETQNLLDSEKLKLIFIIDTHDHVDHVLGNDELKLRSGAKTVAHRLPKITTDVRVDDGDVIRVGNVPVKVFYTPGHSADSICLLVNDEKLLTGDTLYVGSVGSTTVSGGDSKSMYDSLFNKLLDLEDDVEMYPGHDRGTGPNSTLGEEKQSNKVLRSRSIEEFIRLIEHQ
jgi:glyoxylase-like metal-dependent hydrolase (beta-lactamase superfamily II)